MGSLARRRRLEPILVGPLPPGRYEARVLPGAPTDTHGDEGSPPWGCVTFTVQPLVDCEPFGWSVTEVDIGPVVVEIPGWDPDVADGLSGSVEIVARVYLPTTVFGPVVGPMVVFVHGQTPGQFGAELFYLDFSDLAGCVARNGFIFVSVRSPAEDVSFSVDKTVRARHLLGAAWAAHDLLTTPGFGLNFAQVAGDRLVFMGHSRGGEAVSVATRLALDYELVPESFVGAIGATIALAPANHRDETLAGAGMPTSGVAPATLVVCGSWDKDVGLDSAAQEYDAFHLALWQQSAGAYKGLLAIDGVDHFDVTDGVAGGGEGLSKPATRAVTKQYVVSFLLWRLFGDDSQRCWFIGEAVPVFPPEVLSGTEETRLRLLFRLGNEGYVAGHDDVAVEGAAEMLLAVDDGEIGGVGQLIKAFDPANLEPLWPHGYFNEPENFVESNYLWCAAVMWESVPPGAQPPTLVLTIRRPDFQPFWIVPPEHAAPDAQRLVVRFDAVRFMPLDPSPEAGAAIVTLVYAFDEDGDSHLFGYLPGAILEAPLTGPAALGGEAPDPPRLSLSTVVLDFADLEVFLDAPAEVALDRLEIVFGVDAGAAVMSAPRGWYGTPP